MGMRAFRNRWTAFLFAIGMLAALCGSAQAGPYEDALVHFTTDSYADTTEGINGVAVSGNPLAATVMTALQDGRLMFSASAKRVFYKDKDDKLFDAATGAALTWARDRGLAVDDDLTYRRTVALFSKLQPGKANQVNDPAQDDSPDFAQVGEHGVVCGAHECVGADHRRAGRNGRGHGEAQRRAFNSVAARLAVHRSFGRSVLDRDRVGRDRHGAVVVEHVGDVPAEDHVAKTEARRQRRTQLVDRHVFASEHTVEVEQEDRFDTHWPFSSKHGSAVAPAFAAETVCSTMPV